MSVGVNLKEQPASYIIGIDGTTIYAINCKTGKIDYSGTDARTVIQSAINALTNGGKIFIKQGTYYINSSIQYQDEVIIEGEGKDNTILKAPADYSLPFIFTPPDLTVWRNVQIKNLQTFYSGIDFSSVNYGLLENLSIWHAPQGAIKLERTGGNLNILRNIQIENNYQANSVGIRVLADWVHIHDVVIAKTELGGVIIGSDTVKPYNPLIYNLHTFHVRGYTIDIYKAFHFTAIQIEAEIDTTDSLQLGGIRNRATNTDADNFIINFNYQPPSATYEPYLDEAGTLKLRFGGANARTENNGTVTLASGEVFAHNCVITPVWVHLEAINTTIPTSFSSSISPSSITVWHNQTGSIDIAWSCGT